MILRSFAIALGIALVDSLDQGSRAIGRAPVFLVPGLTGSALEVRMKNAHMPHALCKGNTGGDWKKIWLSVGGLLPYEKDCLIARMTLTYDEVSDTYSNLPGIELHPLNFGEDTSHLDLLYSYEFGKMMKHLDEKLGYKAGVDIFLSPYDWRLAGDAHAHAMNGVGGFYDSLKTLIEKQVQKLGERAVVISHSLGCPTMLYFFHKYVDEAWRQKFINHWVAISGPFLGSSMQANAYLGGYTFGLPDWLLPHDYVRDVQINASSGVWLSPHPMAFGDLPIVSTPSKNYTAADIPAILSKIGNEQAMAIMRKHSLDLSLLQSKPSGMQTEHWYSNGIRTAESFSFNDLRHGFNEAPSSTRYGDGDGIVNLRSLQSVERFWGNDATTRVFPNASHFGMLSDGRVLGNLTSLLQTYLEQAVAAKVSPTYIV